MFPVNPRGLTLSLWTGRMTMFWLRVSQTAGPAVAGSQASCLFQPELMQLNYNMKWWKVHSLVVRARGLEHGSREFESRSLHLKPETELREERGLSGCRKGLKTVPLAQA